MDPQLGRWHVVDALAESYMSHSPYAYTKNDPINHIDVMGLAPYSRPWMPNMEQMLMIGGGAVYNGGALNQDFMNGLEGFLDELGPTHDAVDDFFGMGGGGEGSSVSAWYAAGGYGSTASEFMSSNLIWTETGNAARNWFMHARESKNSKGAGARRRNSGICSAFGPDISMVMGAFNTLMGFQITNALLDGIPNPVNPYDGSITGQILKWMIYIKGQENIYDSDWIYLEDMVAQTLFQGAVKKRVANLDAIRGRETWKNHGTIEYFILEPNKFNYMPAVEVVAYDEYKKIEIQSTPYTNPGYNRCYMSLQFSRQEAYLLIYNYIFK